MAFDMRMRALQFFSGKDGWVVAADRAFAEREANAGGHPWPAGPGPLGNSSSSALPASGEVYEPEEEPLPFGLCAIDENDTLALAGDHDQAVTPAATAPAAASSWADGQSVAPAIDQPIYVRIATCVSTAGRSGWITSSGKSTEKRSNAPRGAVTTLTTLSMCVIGSAVRTC